MTYDPFARGPFPVGVRTSEVRDTLRDRTLPVELWYPAADAHVGQDQNPVTQDRYEMFPGFPAAPQFAVRDAAPREGRWPLVLFSHGYSAHRRQSTHVLTHLASHGYVAAAPDHVGNTVMDVMMRETGEAGDPRENALAGVRRSVAARPRDIQALLHALLAVPLRELAEHVDVDRVAVVGHSFGGWTALVTPAIEPRISAVLALAPAGGRSPTYPRENPLAEALDFGWGRAVPTLVLAAERDTLLPLEGMRELFARVPAPKKMVVLARADHLHFLDRIEELHELFRMMPGPALFGERNKLVPPLAELCPPEQAYAFTRGMALLHLDASLKGDARAAAVLAGDVAAMLAEKGIDAKEEASGAG